MVNFMVNWSQIYRGLNLNPVPFHDRCVILKQKSTTSLAESEKPKNFKVKTIPAGEKAIPEFASVMGRLMGNVVTAIPFTRKSLKKMKNVATIDLPEGEFISTDDLLTAHIWRSLIVVRKGQGLASYNDKVTTLIRACNFRKRLELDPGYAANGVGQVTTELTVGEILTMKPLDVARNLRGSLTAHTRADVTARTSWLKNQQDKGFQTKTEFDPDALSFVVSSWGFSWWEAQFGDSIPLCFDHGAHVPIVSVIVPRLNGDGVVVYASGKEEACTAFANAMPPQAC